MLDQRSSTESEAHAYLDRAVLGLLLDIDKQRPWSETEIAREISTPGHVPASLKLQQLLGVVLARTAQSRRTSESLRRR